MTLVRRISTLFILKKGLPKTNCPKCSSLMKLRGDDSKNEYYHQCEECGHKVEIDTNSPRIRKLIDSY